MAWVYIIKTKNDKYYVGSTNDLERRTKQHEEGHTYTTRRLGSDSLVFSQEYGTLDDARSVELKIKKLKRKDYVEKIIKDGYIKVQP